MSSFFAIIFVILPTIYLAIQTRIEFDETINYTYGNVFLLILLSLYIGAITYFGANWINGSERNLFFVLNPPAILLFITPGILVGVILYPKAFLDLIEQHELLTKTNSPESLLKFIGWFTLTINIIINGTTRGI